MAKKRTLNTFRGKFICGDCEAILKTMPGSSIDLVLTSPPYADKRDYGDVDGTIPPDEYVDWFIPRALIVLGLIEIGKVIDSGGMPKIYSLCE